MPTRSRPAKPASLSTTLTRPPSSSRTPPARPRPPTRRWPAKPPVVPTKLPCLPARRPRASGQKEFPEHPADGRKPCHEQEGEKCEHHPLSLHRQCAWIEVRAQVSHTHQVADDRHQHERSHEARTAQGEIPERG